MSNKGKSIQKWIIIGVVVLCVLLSAVTGWLLYEVNSNDTGKISKNRGKKSDTGNAEITMGESSVYEDEDGMKIIQADIGETHIVGLRKNGTVVCCGQGFGYEDCDIKNGKTLKRFMPTEITF